jgi:NAD(P)-dependent dehydrogenase (short-subunit alcohol dehydrogenase family)
MAAYASSKAAENHLTRNIAFDLGPNNIRVNGIAPLFAIAVASSSRTQRHESQTHPDRPESTPGPGGRGRRLPDRALRQAMKLKRIGAALAGGLSASSHRQHLHRLPIDVPAADPDHGDRDRYRRAIAR